MNQDQDRRALLAIVLSVLVFAIWQYFMPDPTPPPVETAATEAAPVPAVGTAPSAAPSTTPSGVVPSRVKVADHGVALVAPGISAEVHSSNGAPRAIEVSGFEATIHVTPIWTWLMAKFGGEAEGEWSPYDGGDTPRIVLEKTGALVLAGAGPLDDDGAGTEGDAGAYTVVKNGDTIVARRADPSGLLITKTYAPGPLERTLRVQVEVHNGTDRTLPGAWVGVVDHMAGSAGSMFDRSSNVTQPQAWVDDDFESIMSVDDVEGADVEEFTGPVSLFGMGDRYFLAALALDEVIDARVMMDQLPGGRVGSFLMDGSPIDPGATRTMSFTAYTGPKDLDTLLAVGHDLDQAVDYGIFGFFSKLLLFLLKLFHTGVGNWGLAIILLTMMIKLVFYPLNQRAYESSEKMKQLQPELDTLKEKYKDDQQLQSQEMMKLWKDNGVSPLGGCLPMLVQLPVFFALYNVMYYSVELYDTSFLYILDLTAADPYGVIPTIYAGLLVLQQAMMPTANMDPTQQKIMKMMPLFFAFIMFSFPSGLVMYFCVNMLLTIVQQWWIRRRLSAAPKATA